MSGEDADPAVGKLLDEVDKISEVPTQPVELVDDDDIAFSCRFETGVEARALFPDTRRSRFGARPNALDGTFRTNVHTGPCSQRLDCILQVFFGDGHEYEIKDCKGSVAEWGSSSSDRDNVDRQV